MDTKLVAVRSGRLSELEALNVSAGEFTWITRPIFRTLSMITLVPRTVSSCSVTGVIPLNCEASTINTW